MKTLHVLIWFIIARNITRIIALLALGALALIALVGCHHDGQPATDTHHQGTYRLVSVDGQTVPCALAHEGATMTIQGGSMTFPGDGSCRSHMEFSVPGHKPLTRDVDATCEQHDAKVTLRWKGAGVTSGVFRDDTFSMDNEDMALVYRK